MSLLGSPLILEDVGALLLGNSFLTADPMGPLLDHNEEDDLPLAFSFSSSFSEGGEATSPPFSLSSPAYTTSLSPSEFSLPSPSRLSSSDSLPPSPTPSFQGTSKAAEEMDPLLLPLTPWLGAGELLDADMGAECRDDAFSGMDWMAEKIDLSDLDLDSLIGSCSSDDPPSSPEELLASLESQMDLDLVDTFASPAPAPNQMLSLGVPLALPTLELPEVADEVRVPADEVRVPAVTLDHRVVVKSEPQSPAPLSPGPLSPAYALELGSEVDVLEVKTAADVAVVPEPLVSLQAAPIVLSLSSSGHFVVVVTPKDEPASLSLPLPSASSGCEDDQSDDSDSGIDSVSSSPPRRPSPSSTPSPVAGSSRTKPYSKPDPGSAALVTLSAKVKSVSGAPKVVEKKLKKMEQNKTAATRYRQKKKSEQDVLNSECSELEKRNRELAEKAESISREIQYLKDLMEEVRSAKNRKKKNS
ncbi:cyclic AMP-dependent transcription factor ATF-4 [Esox lucius]|uniref:Cyclic AMP-dependent transcription factor ATF-4 n=1 Tax=Esox lucius TaxID=8010 RepID=A0AAY5K6L9_ESOLU|nr:cyclic AMP-dependent transcription factor ATF-4 [Esox lucius]